MLPSKLRIKLLKKWAQSAPVSTTAPTATSATSDPAGATAQPTISQPPAFSLRSSPWTWVYSAYNSETTSLLDRVFRMLHIVMHYGTQGKYNLILNQNDVATIDSSSASSPDGKNAILLTQLVFKYFLGNGQPFRPTAAQINQWVDYIKNSQPLLNLSQLNPTGPAAQLMRLGDTFRQTFTNLLDQIKRYNPLQQQR